jgi:hypothetical protein
VHNSENDIPEVVVCVTVTVPAETPEMYVVAMFVAALAFVGLMTQWLLDVTAAMETVSEEALVVVSDPGHAELTTVGSTARVWTPLVMDDVMPVELTMRSRPNGALSSVPVPQAPLMAGHVATGNEFGGKADTLPVAVHPAVQLRVMPL